ncbi:MAG: hypothetical protein RLO50_02690 [Azospirillaceae bacterium]
MFGATTRHCRAAGGAAVTMLLFLGGGDGARAQGCQTIVDALGNPVQICVDPPGQVPIPPTPLLTPVPPDTMAGGDPGVIFVPGGGRLGVEGSTTVPIQLLNGSTLLDMTDEAPPPGTIRVEGRGVGAPAQRLTIEDFRAWTENR